jgi:Interleukin-like EMT inducer
VFHYVFHCSAIVTRSIVQYLKISRRGSICNRFVCAVCLVETSSYGFDDIKPSSGYIAINGIPVINNTFGNAHLGFSTVELNVASCSSSNIREFNTHSELNDSVSLATYINSLPVYTVLIGITADEASYKLNQVAVTALLTIGVNVTELQYRGKVSFVALIGQPALAVSQVAPPGGENLKLRVLVAGTLHIVVNNLGIQIAD